MDSITQIALGAAIGEAVIGKQVGRKGLLWGGICGLFPDLDILVPFGDVVKSFTYHRSASHSLFVLTALTPFVVFLILKLHSKTSIHRTRWYLLVFLSFATHILLDCFTVYGTQIFWPMSTPPVMWSTIFIIDPAYSLPLFTGVLIALIMTRNNGRGHVVNTFCLIISSLYLTWSVGAKVYVNHVAHTSLKEQTISYHKLLTVPSPFNTFLWRILVMNEGGYYEGFYSFFDKTGNIVFNHYPSNRLLLTEIRNHWPVKRLNWFTHGFNSVQRIGKAIVITDLRMGMEPGYVFRFKVGENENAGVRPTKSERIRMRPKLEQLRWVWQRIWSHDIEIRYQQGKFENAEKLILKSG